MKLQIKINGKLYIAEVDVVEDDEKDAAHPLLPAYQPPPINYTPAVPTGAHVPDASIFGGELKVLRSPVNGLVVRLNVQAGQPVQKGDLLMVLESMKMETNIAALGEGVIKTITVAEGQPVKTGEILVAFE